MRVQLVELPLQPPSMSRRYSPNPLAAGAEPIVEFGRFRMLLRRRQLLADGVPVELGTRAFEVLSVLVEARGLLVGKDELLRRVWPGVVVEENNLQVQISALRKVLGEEREYIRTEFGRGYRFTAEIRPAGLETAPPIELPASLRADHRIRGVLDALAALDAAVDQPAGEDGLHIAEPDDDVLLLVMCLRSAVAR